MTVKRSLKAYRSRFTSIIRVKTCITSKYHVLKLLLDEEHGDVPDHVHHGLLEVMEGVFDIIFAFLVKS